MRSRVFATVGGVGVLLGALIACVSDSPSSIGRGELGGPCYPNGSCNTPLVCSSAGLCTAADASADTSADAVVDRSADGITSDACVPPPVPSPAAGPACPGVGGGSCPAGTPCCTMFSSNACQTCTNGNDTTWQCTAPSHCNGMACCLTGAADINSATCPPTLSNVNASTCSASCVGRRLCTTTADCPSGTCTAVGFVTGGNAPMVLGVCL